MNQRQIATALGVSQTTVSLVLNNPETEKVSRKKRDLILDFLHKHNYSTTSNNGKTKNIAYLFPNDISCKELYQGFYDRFILGVEAAASLAGYNIIIEKFKKDGNLVFPQNKVDGVILEGAIDLDKLKEIAHRIPMVTLNYSVCEPVCDMIFPDDTGGVEMAMRFLHKMGHARIAYFMAKREPFPIDAKFSRRLEGYRSLVYSLQLEQDDAYIQEAMLMKSTMKLTEIEIRKALQVWQKMKNPPTAVICSSDLYALQMIRQANMLGIKIPEDLSIIGIDNIPSSELSFPALTSIDHNAEEMGRLSVEALIKRINDPERPTRRISCNASLIIRESVANLNK